MRNEIFNTPFHLFSSCIPVKGYNRGIIYDLQRQDFHYIPIELVDILHDYNGKFLNEIIAEYGEDNEHNINEYFEFLLENEYIFFSELDISYFPSIPEEFERPFKISNIIIDFSSILYENLSSVTDQIDKIGCESILFRFLTEGDFEKYFLSLMDFYLYSSVRSLEIHTPFSEKYTFDFEDITLKYGKMARIVFFSSIKEYYTITKSHTLLVYINNNILDKEDNVIDLKNFVINDRLFFESKLYNNYFNKKIYIDTELNIKNSPNSNVIFGNIINDKIISVLNKSKFQQLWNVSKDMIKGCNICEYRYMCIDSSIVQYDENEKIWESETICPYNPVTSKWN